jgi:hypothetical protein
MNSSDRPSVRQTLPAFSRPLDVDAISEDGIEIAIEADPGECAAVAAEIELPAIAALSAAYRVERRADGRFEVRGELKARVTQVCVVSLEPFDSEISRHVEIAFAHVRPVLPDRQVRQRNNRAALRRGIDLLPPPAPVVPIGEGEADPPDPIVDRRIDLGAVTVEFLTLALDFYPKKPGVHFSDVVIGEKDEPKLSAFAALERFKDRS